MFRIYLFQTKYYQRILQMVCVADFVDFDQYIDPQWTWYERACAISALTGKNIYTLKDLRFMLEFLWVKDS